MAANMQHMAGAGHMMQQQMQQMHQHMRKNTNQYQTTIFQRLSSTPVPPGGWQASISINDRMGKTMELYASPQLPSSASALVNHLNHSNQLTDLPMSHLVRISSQLVQLKCALGLNFKHSRMLVAR